MHIRCATANDLSALEQLDKQVNLTYWTQKQYYDSLKSKHHEILVGVIERQIVACVVYSIAYTDVDILQIWVSTLQQNKGYAKQLLATVLQNVKKMAKVDKIFLEVRSDNHRAKHVYQQAGFVEVGRRKDYYKVDGWTFDGLVMLKQIKMNDNENTTN